MALIKLQRAVFRKSAYAVYAFNLFKLEVYLRNNKPCKNEWGDFYLSCYVNPNSSSTDTEKERHEFFDYASFREYRKMLYAAHGSDKRLKPTKQLANANKNKDYGKT